MFTGIITDIATVAVIQASENGTKMQIDCAYDMDGIDLGASIASDGCCLTVTHMEKTASGGTLYSVDVANETLSCTTIGDWQEGQKINLERAMGVGEELGGHIVTGHVDGLATVIERKTDGDAQRFTLEVPEKLAKYIAQKGSVALNGVSLTVNEVEANRFGISLIPHTLKMTTWGDRHVGDKVNLEVDLLARYVARLNEFGN